MEYWKAIFNITICLLFGLNHKGLSKVKTMNNSKSSFSISEFLSLLQKHPVKAYNLFVSRGKYFNSEFWEEFKKVSLFDLEKQHPSSEKQLENFVVIQFLAYVHAELGKCIKAKKKEIEALKPSKELLLKSLYLCLELADKQNGWPSYNEESFRAIKRILQNIKLKSGGESKDSPSKELFNAALALLEFTMDQASITEFLDLFLFAGFEYKKEEEGHLLVLDNKSKSKSPYLNNLIKSQIKRAHLRKEAQTLISEDKHFLINDPEWRTNEGRLTVLHNENFKVSETTPGTTSKQVPNELFEKLNSDDPAIKNEGIIWQMWYQVEQGFHLNLREAISEAYLPNDVIDIHSLKIPFSEVLQISIFDFFCITSCIVSNAKIYQELSQSPYSNIGALKSLLYNRIQKGNSHLSEKEIYKECDSNLVLNYKEYEKGLTLKPLLAFAKTDMLSMLRKVEELKQKTDDELITILDFLSNLASSLPFSPIYRIGEKYYFSYSSCSPRFNRVIYDSFISNELFNDKNKEAYKQKKIGTDQNDRSQLFHQSLQDDLLKYATAAKTVQRPGKKGDFDVLAYFKKENALLVIQVKLSNTSPFTEKRKAEWIDSHLKMKGIAQIQEDLEFLDTPMGMAFVVRELGLKKSPPHGIKIYPLIVTDNFYADHLSLPINKRKQSASVVSYFELKNLIHNKKVEERQESWEIDKSEPAKSIISLVEKNTFWGFIKPLITKAKLEKSLFIKGELDIKLRL